MRKKSDVVLYNSVFGSPEYKGSIKRSLFLILPLFITVKMRYNKRWNPVFRLIDDGKPRDQLRQRGLKAKTADKRNEVIQRD